MNESKKMKNCITYAVFLASLIMAGTSLAQNAPNLNDDSRLKFGDPNLPKPKSKPSIPKNLPPPIPGLPKDGIEVKWRGGSNVETCLKSGECIKRPLPKAVGKPISVIRLPLMNDGLTPASTLVISNKRYSLCYLTGTKSSAVNECHPIKAPVIKGGHIRSISYPGIGTILSISVDPAVASTMKPNELRSYVLQFGKGLAQAQKSATKIAARRYSGKLITRPYFADPSGGGDGCYMGDEEVFCSSGGGSGGTEGGGGYWPDEPSSGDNGGVPADDGSEGGAPSGTDDGGGFPDDGGQVIPIPLPTIPPGTPSTPNEAGGTTTCFPVPGGGTCIITAPDPNRVDPDTGGQLPPSTDTSWSWCDLPIISWFCGNASAEPPPSNPPAQEPDDDLGLHLPPFQWPARPEDGRPVQRYREGYEDALSRCDADRGIDEKKCSIKYTILGGPIYTRKLEEEGKLTPSERKMLKDAKKEYSSCMDQAGEFWGQCYKDAMDNYRE